MSHRPAPPPSTPSGLQEEPAFQHPAKNVEEPSFPAAVAGRFSLFFLWLAPSAVAVFLYYLLIGVAMVMGHVVEGKIDTNALMLVLPCVFAVIYIPALLILTMIATGVTRISQGSGNGKKRKFLLPYFLINIVLGPTVLLVWWYLDQRM